MIGIWFGLVAIFLLVVYVVFWLFPKHSEAMFNTPAKKNKPQPKPLELSKIPFKEFQKFLVDGEVDFLGGQQEAQRLYLDYLDAKMTDKEKNGLFIEGKILENWMRVNYYQLQIDSLKEVYTPLLAERIGKEFGLPMTPETYHQDLIKIVSKAKKYKIEYDRYEAEKNLLITKANGAEAAKIGYDYYTDITLAIGKMQGYHIPNDVDTRTWCRLYSDLVNKIDKSKNQNGKGTS